MKPDCGTPKHGPAVLRDGRLGCVRAERTRRAGRRGEQGQAITEFAMVLPVLAFLALVLILFGKALFVYIEVTHAANEGARLAAVDRPCPSGLAGCDSPQAASLQSFLTSEYALPGGAQIAICYPNGNSQTYGNPVEVDVYSNVTWVPVINVGQIKSAATMRIEQDTSLNPDLQPTTTFDPSTGMCKT